MIEKQQINFTFPSPTFKYLKPAQYLQQVINYAANNGQLLSKFTPVYIAQTISITKLEKWSQIFPNNSCISMQQFISLFGSMIPHTKNETIYLIISLMEIYEQLKYKYQKNNQTDSIQYGQITNFLCEKILYDNNVYKLPLKAQNQKNCSSRSSPSVTYMYEQIYPYICSQGITKQKSLKNAVKQLQYSQKMKKIICLSYHSKQIQLFDLNLKQVQILEPLSFKKLKKQSIIISFAYSQLNLRIGCVIYNRGLLFWEAGDRFETQKVIQNIKADSIFYLKYNDEWGTIKNNVITIWNIHSQKQRYNLTIPQCNQICHLQQINQTPNLIVSIICKNKSRYLHLYSFKEKARLLSKIQIDSLGCHRLYYNVSTRTILQIGYNKNIKVWHSDPLTFQLIAQGYLEGHRANVTSVTTIGQSSIIATSDQKGNVKLWDLRQLRCYQTFRLSFKQICQLIYVDQYIIYGDSRINIKSLDYKKQSKNSIQYIRSFYDENSKKNYIFDSISCSIANQNTGEIQYIFKIFDGDQELTCIQKQKNFFVLGTNKGNIILIDKSFKKRKSIKIHQTNIMRIFINSKLKSLITVSNDQSLILSMLDCDNESVVCKKTLIDLPINQIQNLLFQVSNADYLIGISLNNCQIMLIDMESLKIFESKVFSHKVITFKFHLFYQVFVVCLENNKIYIIEYSKTKSEFKILSRIELTLFQIFNFTQEINMKESITMMFISKKGDLICVWDHKFIEIYDLQQILVDLKRQKNQQKRIFQALILRNVSDSSNFIYQNRNQTKNNKEIQQFSQLNSQRKELKRIWCKNINKNYNIEKIDENDEVGIINLICNKNVLLTLDSKTLQVQCERKQNQTYPKIWNKLSINKQKLKNKLIKSIKLCQKIYQTDFKQQIKQFIDLQQLNPCNFLSTLTRQKIRQVNYKENINNYRKQNKIKQNRHQSLFEPKNMSLKIMETQKRLNRMHQMQKKKNQSMPINRKILEQLKNKNQNSAQDPFFRVKIDQRFSIGSKNQGDTCQLYDRIQKKYQKSKQKKVIRSISSFGIPKFNISKYKTIKNVQEPTMKRNKISNKNILKSKIENMYLSKDKRTQIIRKILKRQYIE